MVCSDMEAALVEDATDMDVMEAAQFITTTMVFERLRRRKKVNAVGPIMILSQNGYGRNSGSKI